MYTPGPDLKIKLTRTKFSTDQTSLLSLNVVTLLQANFSQKIGRMIPPIFGSYGSSTISNLLSKGKVLTLPYLGCFTLIVRGRYMGC